MEKIKLEVKRIKQRKKEEVLSVFPLYFTSKGINKMLRLENFDNKDFIFYRVKDSKRNGNRYYLIKNEEDNRLNYYEEIEGFISDTNNQPGIDTIDRLFNEIENLTSVGVNRLFFVFRMGREFYFLDSPFVNDCFIDNFYFSFKFVAESDAFAEYFGKILALDASGKSSFFSSRENNFNFITNKCILRLLLEKELIIERGEQPFKQFKIPKKSGGMRIIYAPDEKIKASLRDLNKILQAVYDWRNSTFQIAYKKNKSIRDGAKVHKENEYVFNMDLKDFFPSCKRKHVQRYVEFLFKYSLNREFILEEFLSVILINDGLFIGSPISGTLANVVISKPVLYLRTLCKNSGKELSVYADDISISSSKFITKESAKKLFETAFSKYGLLGDFNLNDKKLVGFSKCNRKIAGVSLNGDNKMTVSRKYWRAVRSEIQHLDSGDASVNIQKLRGKIAYATMLDESGKVLRYLEKFKKTVKKYKLCSDEKIEEMKNRI